MRATSAANLGFRAHRFALTNDEIYFIPEPPNSASLRAQYLIQRLDLSTGKIHTIARLEKSPFIGLTVSPDRRWMLYTQHDQSGTDLKLLENSR